MVFFQLFINGYLHADLYRRLFILCKYVKCHVLMLHANIFVGFAIFAHKMYHKGKQTHHLMLLYELLFHRHLI